MRKRPGKVWKILFAVYLILLFYFLFVSEMFGRTSQSGEYRYNLVPLQEIKRCIYYYRSMGFGIAFINLVGNVVAFMPFGFYLGMCLRGWFKLPCVTLLSFWLSFMVETAQLVTRRGCFDVDDMILNTLGGFLGCVLYLIFDGLARWHEHRKKTHGTK